MPYISFKFVFSFFSFPTLYDGIGVERVKYLSRKQESQERQEGEKDKNSKKKNPPKRERITLLAFFRICFPFPSNVIPPPTPTSSTSFIFNFFRQSLFSVTITSFSNKTFHKTQETALSYSLYIRCSFHCFSIVKMFDVLWKAEERVMVSSLNILKTLMGTKVMNTTVWL